MPKRVRVRALTDEERKAIDRLVHSRTASVREAECARLVDRASRGKRGAEIAPARGGDRRTVRRWLTRFNAAGLDGRGDEPRSGQPPTSSPAQVGEVRAASWTKPTDLGRPVARWTLERLAASLNEAQGIPLQRRRSDDLLLAAGWRGRIPDGWFCTRAGREKTAGTGASADKPIDPAVARKRGRARPSPRRRHPLA
jgi:transposase